MSDWNPELYLRFAQERNQPVADLLARLGTSAPSRILDVGCGPGNSAGLLAERWPYAIIVGIDNSRAMLERAGEKFPGRKWVLRDANDDLSDLGLFNLVFSNAALQWMPDHDRLLPNLFSCLARGGTLAAQVPNNAGSPIVAAISEVIESRTWRERFGGIRSGVSYRSVEEYYDRLCLLGRDPALWETRYIHVMDALSDMVEWMRGAFLRKYFDCLSGDAAATDGFVSDILENLKGTVPQRPDGKYLFPYLRLFFTLENI